MLGGLGAYIASEVSGAVRRNVVVYGLFGFALLLTLGAVGYGLSALHTVLAISYGPVAASLWIAGGLLLAGIFVLLLALYIKGRPRPSRPLAETALIAAPIAARLVGSRMSWKTGATIGIAVLGLVLGRQLFKGGEAEDEEA